jgi:thiamine-phosphate pyrophosphorylase
VGRRFSPLNVICDADACARAGWALADFAAACLEGGATFLQVRAKSAESGWLLDVCSRVVQVANAFDALVVVNDRADVAMVSGAGGVHVGQNDLTPAAVRRLVGPSTIIGLSTHTLDQVDDAVIQPIDYLAVGPIFPTGSKDTGYEAVGLDLLGEACGRAQRHGLPVVAIGGITLERAPQACQAGAAAVAVIGDLLATGNPEQRVREYLRTLQ